MNTKTHLLLSIFLLFTTNQIILAAVCNWEGNTDNNWETASNWSCGNVPTADDEVYINGGGTISLNSDLTVALLEMDGTVEIIGSGSLTANEAMNLLSAGEYTFDIAINVIGNADFGDIELNQNGQNLTLAGTGTWEDGTLWCNNGAQVIIPTGASFTFENGINIFSFNPVPSLVVNGTMTKQGASPLDFEAIYNFVDATINIENGPIVNYLQAGDNCLIENSTINITGNGALEIARIISIENTQFNGGTIRTTFGVASFRAGTDCSTTHLHLIDGIVNNNAPTSFQSVLQTGGQFNGGSSGFTVEENFDFVGGEISGNIEVLGMTNISDVTTTSDMRSTAILRVTGGGSMNTNDNFQNRIVISENSIFEITCETNTTTSINDLQVFGTVAKSGEGLLDIYGFFYPEDGQRVAGFGPITTSGSFLLRGTLVPTSTQIALELQSNLSFTGDNPALEIILFVDGAGNALYGEVLVEGSANLSGTIEVDEVGSAPNGMYTILTATDGVKNTFDTENLPAGYTVIYTANSVILNKSVAPPALASSLSTTSNITCAGFNDGCIQLNISGGMPPYTIDGDVEVSNGQMICGLAAGDYTYTIIDANGTSTTTNSTTITEPEELTIALNMLSMDSVEIIATGGTPPYQYQLAGGDLQDENTFELLLITEPVTYIFDVIDANACLASYSLTINNIEENNLSNSLIISPNPSQGTIQLAIDFPTKKEVQLSVLDITGREVFKADLSKTTNRYETSVDLSFLNSGTYMLLLNDGEQMGVKRLVLVD